MSKDSSKGFLVLTLKEREPITIGDVIVMWKKGRSQQQISIMIRAPKEISINRYPLIEEKDENEKIVG